MSNAAKTIPLATMTKPATPSATPVQDEAVSTASARPTTLLRAVYIALLALVLLAPVIGLYPVFVMKLLCFALFACAFNLLLGFTGLLSFGHAAFFGMGAYTAGWLIKSA